MKAFYDNEPSRLEGIGNGSYYYRWDIKEVEVSSLSEDMNERRQWECEEVTVWLPLTSNKITTRVINELWDSNYEQKLVNDYNAAQLGVYTEEESKQKIEAYKTFLTNRNQIKEKIDQDCKELGIR